MASEMPPVCLRHLEGSKPLRDDIGSGWNSAGYEQIQNCGAGLHLSQPGLGNGMGRGERLEKERGSDGREIGWRMLQAGNLQHGSSHVAKGALGQRAGEPGGCPPERGLCLKQAPSRDVHGTGTGA